VYLGLKTGWTFGASLFGSIFGYAILKPLSRALPNYVGGGYFGPKENVCVQSAATAAGSLGLLFTSGFPAAYQIGLLGASPKDDIGKLCTFTLCCAFYGMFFAVPLRKYYILKQKLLFPSAVAAAYTIRSLHVGKNAEANARKKTKALILAFTFAITLRVVSEYALECCGIGIGAGHSTASVGPGSLRLKVGTLFGSGPLHSLELACSLDSMLHGPSLAAQFSRGPSLALLS
jgi:uncharacterized oligopeptide transporter (OPT) family protein